MSSDQPGSKSAVGSPFTRSPAKEGSGPEATSLPSLESSSSIANPVGPAQRGQRSARQRGISFDAPAATHVLQAVQSEGGQPQQRPHATRPGSAFSARAGSQQGAAGGGPALAGERNRRAEQLPEFGSPSSPPTQPLRALRSGPSFKLVLGGLPQLESDGSSGHPSRPAWLSKNVSFSSRGALPHFVDFRAAQQLAQAAAVQEAHQAAMLQQHQTPLLPPQLSHSSSGDGAGRTAASAQGWTKVRNVTHTVGLLSHLSSKMRTVSGRFGVGELPMQPSISELQAPLLHQTSSQLSRGSKGTPESVAEEEAADLEAAAAAAAAAAVEAQLAEQPEMDLRHPLSEMQRSVGFPDEVWQQRFPKVPAVPDAGPLTAITIGCINVMVAIPAQIAFATIVFQDALYRPYLGALCKFLFFSSAIHQITFMAMSSLPPAVGQVQDIGLIFLSAIATSVAAICVDSGLSDRVALGTCLVTLCIATFIVGLLTLLFGKLQLARLTQYVPNPVVMGYLAYVGYFLFAGGVGLTAGVQLDSIVNWVDVARLDLLPKLLCMVATAVLLRVACSSMRVLSSVLLVIPLLFHAVLSLTGSSLQQAQETDWVMKPMDSSSIHHFWDLWSYFNLDLDHGVEGALNSVHWPAVSAQIVKVIGLFIVVCFGSCLDVTAIQAASPTPLNFDQELVTVGTANIMTSLLGAGYTGSYIISQTKFTLKTGVRTRVSSACIAAMELTVFALPFSVVQYVPKFFFGALLLWFGVDFLTEQFWDSRKKLSRAEYVLLLLTFLCIMWLGLMAGIGVGIIMTTFVFAYEYAKSTASSLNPVSVTSGTSSTMYSYSHMALLDMMLPRRVVGVSLSGFVFFGNSVSIGDRVEAIADALVARSTAGWLHGVSDDGSDAMQVPATAAEAAAAALAADACVSSSGGDTSASGTPMGSGRRALSDGERMPSLLQRAMLARGVGSISTGGVRGPSGSGALGGATSSSSGSLARLGQSYLLRQRDLIRQSRRMRHVLTDVMLSKMRDAPMFIILDFRNVPRLDSTGAGRLASLNACLNAKGVQMLVSGLRQDGHMADLLSANGLHCVRHAPMDLGVTPGPSRTATRSRSIPSGGGFGSTVGLAVQVEEEGEGEGHDESEGEEAAQDLEEQQEEEVDGSQHVAVTVHQDDREYQLQAGEVWQFPSLAVASKYCEHEILACAAAQDLVEPTQCSVNLLDVLRMHFGGGCGAEGQGGAGAATFRMDAGSQLFPGLSLDKLSSAMEKYMEEVPLARGDLLFQSGEVLDNLYLIEQGRLHLYSPAESPDGLGVLGGRLSASDSGLGVATCGSPNPRPAADVFARAARDTAAVEAGAKAAPADGIGSSKLSAAAMDRAQGLPPTKLEVPCAAVDRALEFGPGCFVCPHDFTLTQPTAFTARCFSRNARVLKLRLDRYLAMRQEQPDAFIALQVAITRSISLDLSTSYFHTPGV